MITTIILFGYVVFIAVTLSMMLTVARDMLIRTIFGVVYRT